MHKSIYSLVLSDGVVEALDRMAYLRGYNRSQLINEILAEYVSYVTPEQRIREAFGRISAMLDGSDTFRLMSPPSDTLLSLGSPLLYKYNPTVRYSVELFREEGGTVGELRVSLRTQNAALLHALTQFYRLFDAVEQQALGPTGAAWSEGRYARPLRLRVQGNTRVGSAAPELLGELIAAYIRVFDAALKIYFRQMDEPAVALREIERVYHAYLRSHTAVV